MLLKYELMNFIKDFRLSIMELMKLMDNSNIKPQNTEYADEYRIKIIIIFIYNMPP